MELINRQSTWNETSKKMQTIKHDLARIKFDRVAEKEWAECG
jgi:hypothetical protein